MSVTKAEYAQLQAQARCPIKEGWDGGALSVWVPGTPGHEFTVANTRFDGNSRICRICSRAKCAAWRQRQA